MAEATSSGFYERQRALKLRLAELADARDLAWFSPERAEPVRDERRRPW